MKTPSPIAQSVASLIADPGVMSSFPAWPNTLVEIDCLIFSMVVLLLLLIQEGLLLVTSQSMHTEYWLTTHSKLAQEKSVVR